MTQNTEEKDKDKEKDINDLIVSTSSDHFLTLLEDTLSLGVTLGYSEKDIINSFIYGD